MQIFFNSRLDRYKKPFGATKAGDSISITVDAPHGVFIEYIDVEMVKVGETPVYYRLNYCGEHDGMHSFHTDIAITSCGIYKYRFICVCENGIKTFGKTSGGYASESSGEYYQQTVTTCDYTTPQHLKGGIIYHIFVDRFAIGGRRVNSPYGIMKEWGEEVTIVDNDGIFRANDFYGGNLQGVIDRLNYIKSLGVTLIYLSPIFKSSSNHRYDTGDYMMIDEMLGDEKTFKSLIDEAAKLGIGIMLDGVFNHTGADSLYFNKFGHYDSVGAYQGIKSPFFDWYHFINFPNEYACWWGITVTPTVNKLVESYRRFIMGGGGVLDKWTSMGLKGWRLDVVDELDADFVTGIRETVKQKGNEIAVIGEVWEDASTKIAYGTMRPYLLGGQLDGVMNYPFKDSIIKYVTGGNRTEFIEEIMTIVENYPKQSLDSSMTLLGTHDTARILSVLSGADMVGTDKEYRKNYRMDAALRKKAIRLLKIAAAIQFFLPGVPSIYYGDEIGMEGYEDPLNRRTMDWNNADEELLKHYRKLGSLRADNRRVFGGEFKISEYNEMLLIERTEGVNNKKIALYVNLNDKDIKINKLTVKAQSFWIDIGKS